jgi:dTDP-glucose pyrophosphorylase
MSELTKAVILARGLGTRMRKADDSAELSAEEQAIAKTGVKAMIPIADGHTFVEFVLIELADAGYTDVCLIIGPEHGAVREFFEGLPSTRIKLHFAIQAEPLGTADAVAAAKDFAGDDDILVINSDNYYPPEALAGLRELDGAGLAAFQRDGMLAGSNIPAERISKFAVIDMDGEGNMKTILEKPDPSVIDSLPEPICVSMNCWRFTPAIFKACASIQPSARGELEVTDAVQYAIDELGERFAAPQFASPVLDLSSRADIAPVKEALKDATVRL